MWSSKNRKLLAVAPQVRGLIRREFRTSVPVEATAVAVSSKPSWNILGSLFGKKPVELPPLYDPLPGVKPAPELFVPESLTTNVTEFSNGLKIASENTPGPTCAVGIYINSGSIYETPQTAGCSHLLERMAFKSTLNRTHFRLVRELEAIGAHVGASASREQMVYTSDALKTYLPEILELLADSVRNPLFADWEVHEQAEIVRQEVKQASTNPQTMIVEALHSAGYAGALSNPLIASEANLGQLNGDVLMQFIQENYTAPRMVVAGAGVDHEELVALAEPLFSDFPKGPPETVPNSKYVGGDWRASHGGPETSIALGFELPGGWSNEKDSVAAVVLQTLMGGGGSFSAGGPGKGMYSRLYTNLLSKNSDITTCSAFSSVYNNTGMIGVYASSKSETILKVLNAITNEILDVATPGGVTAKELRRAKNATIASVLMNLESKSIVAEDIGRQILTYGHRKPPQEFINVVESLTAADITAVAKKVTQTPLCMVAYGNVIDVPRLDQVAARFG